MRWTTHYCIENVYKMCWIIHSKAENTLDTNLYIENVLENTFSYRKGVGYHFSIETEYKNVLHNPYSYYTF